MLKPRKPTKVPRKQLNLLHPVVVAEQIGPILRYLQHNVSEQLVVKALPQLCPCTWRGRS
jgi:hypothetical protein